MTQAITDRFPDHSILGEEDEEEGSPARDFVWALDPLDGTKNYLMGLPVYACSVGVMYRGVPIVGAVFLPWPSDGGGVVLHARQGGGAFLEQAPISVSKPDGPRGTSLVGLPGFFAGEYRSRKPMGDQMDELRVTGSIAYELAMAAKGVLRYSVTTAPHLWDVVAGAVLVTEAGGLVIVGRRTGGLRALLTPTRWEHMESFVPDWQSSKTTMKELRRWSAPMVLGSPEAVRYVTTNMRRRFSLRYRLARLAGSLKRRHK